MPFILWWVLFGPLRLPIQTLLTEYLISVLNSASHLHIHASISVCLLVRPSCIPIQPVRNAHAIIQPPSRSLCRPLCARVCVWERAADARLRTPSLSFSLLDLVGRWALIRARCWFGWEWSACLCAWRRPRLVTRAHTHARHTCWDHDSMSLFTGIEHARSLRWQVKECVAVRVRVSTRSSHITHALAHARISSLEAPTRLPTATRYRHWFPHSAHTHPLTSFSTSPSH